MFNNIIAVVLVIFAITGCDKDKRPTDTPADSAEQVLTSVKNEEVEQPQAIESTKISKEKLALMADKLNKNKQAVHSVQINGEKYITSAESLTQGSEVFNMQMNEYGTIKGTLVIVSQRLDSQELEYRYSLTSIKQIAKNTYRVRPVNGSALYEVYLSLLKATDIERVELEVDFSGKSSKIAVY